MRNRFSSNLITRHIRDYSSIYTFIMVLFLMGIIFGAVLVNSLSAPQKEDLFYYLNQYFTKVSAGETASSEELFKLSLLHNIKFTGLMWVLGISIIGFPLIFILIFIKGIVVGFSVGFLVNQMGWNGLLLSFVSLFPQNLFIIPVIIFIGACSVGFSMMLIRKIFIRKSITFQLTPIFSKYILAFIAAVAILTIAASVEAYIAPALMKTIITSISN
ncbi:stage II sporulation protein M [Lederbergia lenta]|uniref:Stage II sporulation protein M n=1 Tax=Lederbergia lenta TaxID=1467 RepID=A0A2X4W026_LEDLE|nr:stage II sporulation protein M [Lederbergia lenta]MCM3111558.1 stage II sporulation protein M [Lederbergia lenta]MEC2325054.1 stage II sporulation protein M [Lederbergia lenta]SQI56451.1 stage II sporulation autolysin protein [Lederbergia lenta]